MKTKKIASELNKQLKGSKPFFIAVKSDSFIFFSDIVREIKADMTCDFIQFDSNSLKKSDIDITSLNLKGKTVVYVFGKKLVKKHWQILKTKSLKQGAEKALAASPFSTYF